MSDMSDHPSLERLSNDGVSDGAAWKERTARSGMPSRKTWWIVAAALMCLALVVLAYYWELSLRLRVRISLPVGSSRSEVESWLDTHKLPHDCFNVMPDFVVDMIGSETVIERAQLQGAGVASYVRVEKKDVLLPRQLAIGDVFLYLFFDKNDRLVGQSLETHAVFP